MTTNEDTTALIVRLRSAAAAALGYSRRARDKGRGIGSAAYEAEAELYDLAADRLAALTAPQEGEATESEIQKAALVLHRANGCMNAECVTPDAGELFAAGIVLNALPRKQSSHAPQEGDARERLAEVIWDAWDERDCDWSEVSALEKSRWRSVANMILTAFPTLGRDIAGEIEAEAAKMTDAGLGDSTRNGLELAAEIVRNGR